MTKILPLFQNEYDLARAIAKGNQKACGEFYEKYSAKFLGICCRYINDRMAAEDVMVDSMMKIFEKSSQFNFTGSFEGWAKRVVVNESLQYIRKNRPIEVDIDEAGGICEAVELISSHLEVENLIKLIEGLPQGYRTVFNLYAIEGYSHQEIAQMLGISEGTSKSQLSRARMMLQENIKKNNVIVSKIENGQNF
jgi:RNA polymerase sigma factor (sigma-70 family)